MNDVNEQDILSILDALGEAKGRLDVLESDHKAQIEALIPPDVKLAMLAIEANHEAEKEQIEEMVAMLEKKTKELVVAHGSTVKGRFAQAVYTKGRVSWDDKGLSSLMEEVPVLRHFRKEGEPSVSIRVVKQ